MHGRNFPLRYRIAVRIAGLVRDGLLPAGSRLPSVRVLARHLGVHRNTVSAAYHELRAAGLVDCRMGSGVYVRPLRAPAPERSADRFQRGPPSARTDLPGVQVVEPASRLRQLFVRELQQRGVSPMVPAAAITGSRPGELRGTPPRSGAVLLARPSVACRLSVPCAGPDAFTPLIVAGGSRELARTLALPGPGVVAVITWSRSARRLARVLHSSHAARGLGLMTPRPADGRAVRRALSIADIVFADVLCAELPEIRQSQKLDRMWLLSELTLVRVRRMVRQSARERGSREVIIGLEEGHPGNLLQWVG